MELKDLVETVTDECRRLERNKKLKREVREAFETAPEFDEIPISLQKEIDHHNFFYDGPEVTTPADEFLL